MRVRNSRSLFQWNVCNFHWGFSSCLCYRGVHDNSEAGVDPHRFPPFYENRSEFSWINKFFMKKKKLSKLKSGQYPDWMTQVTLGSEKTTTTTTTKKLTGVHALEPPRSLPLRRLFWKTVSYPRSAPARCPQGENWLYSDKHSNLFPHVCPLWNFDLLEQSVIFNFFTPFQCSI